MARTYKSKLYSLAHQITVYIGRWEPSLEVHMTTEQITALKACLTCASSLAELLKPDVIVNEEHPIPS